MIDRSALMIDAADRITALDLATGDFDGDGTAGVLVALSLRDAGGILLSLDDTGNGFGLQPGETKRFSIPTGATRLTLLVAAGNVDLDDADEFAVVLNGNTGSLDSGSAQYAVFDDLIRGGSEISPLQEDGTRHAVQVVFPPGPDDDGNPETPPPAPPPVPAIFANLTFADIDNDGLDEILFGGLQTFRGMNDGTDVTPTGPFRYTLLAIDDAIRLFNPLGSKLSEEYLVLSEKSAASQIVALERFADPRIPG